MNRLQFILYLIGAAALIHKGYPVILSMLIVAWGFIVLIGHFDEEKEEIE